MIRKVFYDSPFVEYLVALKDLDEPYYEQHLRVIRRVCKALAEDAEKKHGVTRIEGTTHSFRIDLEAELLDKVYPPDGYRIRFTISQNKVFVSSITFTDIDN